MDYNYVRMRNALKAGDEANAEYYRLLFEKRRYKKEDTKGLNMLLILCASSGFIKATIIFTKTPHANRN